MTRRQSSIRRAFQSELKIIEACGERSETWTLPNALCNMGHVITLFLSGNAPISSRGIPQHSQGLCHFFRQILREFSLNWHPPGSFPPRERHLRVHLRHPFGLWLLFIWAQDYNSNLIGIKMLALEGLTKRTTWIKMFYVAKVGGFGFVESMTWAVFSPLPDCST